MSKQAVYLVVDFAINEGQVDAFEGIAQTMVADTQKEPGALAYEWYFSADRKKCRLVETYADANAVLATATVLLCRSLCRSFSGPRA